MRLSFSWFDLIVSLSVLQGIIMAVILCFLPVKVQGKKLISLVLLVLALLSLKILLHTIKLWDLPLFRYFPLAVDTTLQPLLYLYVCAITIAYKPFIRSWVHFTPTIIFMLYALVVYLRVLPEPSLQAKDALANGLYFDSIKSFEDAVAVASAITYWVVGYRRITGYRQWLFRTQSNNQLQELTWLRNLLLLSGLLVLGVTAVVALDSVIFKNEHHFIHLQIFYLFLGFVIYYLSLKSFQLYGLPRPIMLQTEQPPETAETLVDDEEDDLFKPEIKTSHELEIIKARIIQALEEDRLFLHPELTVKELARHINSPAGLVSSAINQCFQMNFRNLVNQYRVDEIKKQLLKPSGHLSILGIALDCGFNSEASFYRIFRQQTGLSPQEYIHQHQP